MRVIRAAALVCVAVLAGCGRTPPSGPAAGGIGSASAAISASARSGAPGCRAAMPEGAPAGPDAVSWRRRADRHAVRLGTTRLGGGAKPDPATSDGGRHWTVQDHGDLQLGSVDFADASHGWAAGARMLLATSDGGRRWTALRELCRVIRQVHFNGEWWRDAVAIDWRAGTATRVLFRRADDMLDAIRAADGESA